MTKIYFVRHAQSLYPWKDDDCSRPLTVEGTADSKRVSEALSDIKLDYCVCSPYKRSIDTIRECAQMHHLKINTDARFGERINGGLNTHEMIRKRWDNFDFHEENGESLNMVQQRNMSGVLELLEVHKDESILFGTHGTALSTILNYYDRDYDFNSFLRIIDFMPYIICLTFNNKSLVKKEEILILEKEYKG